MAEQRYGFEACWKPVVIDTFRCRKPKGHEGGCHGVPVGAPYVFGPDRTEFYHTDWSPASTEIWNKIWRAVEYKTILTLSREEVDRLGGMLWNIGVFK